MVLAPILEVVRSDIGQDLRPRGFSGSLVDPGVDEQDGNTGVVGFADGRHQFFRTRGCEQNGVDILLDQILDDLVLPFDIGLTVCRQRHQTDSARVLIIFAHDPSAMLKKVFCLM